MSRILTVTIAAFALSTGAAFAQCADEQTTGSISKDGSTMPLEESEDQAMSSDDVEAQQEGEDAAAAAADDCAEDDAG